MCCCVLSSANKCLLKVGAYCAQLEQYQKAIEIYEQVCPTCMWCIHAYLSSISTWHFWYISYDSFRLEPTRWTTPCWNTAPRSTSSKPPSVTSLSTSSTLRQVYTSVVQSQDLGRGNGGRILTRRLSTDRSWKIWGDVPGFLRLSRMQAVEGNSMWRTLRSLMAYFSTLICSVSMNNPLFFCFVLSQQKLLEAHEEQNSEAFTEAVSQESHCFSPCSFVGSLVCSGKWKAGSQVSSQSLRTVCLCHTGTDWNA